MKVIFNKHGIVLYNNKRYAAMFYEQLDGMTLEEVVSKLKKVLQ